MTDTELLNHLERLLVRGDVVEVRPTYLSSHLWQVAYKHMDWVANRETRRTGGGITLRAALESMIGDVIAEQTLKELKK